MSSAVQRGDWFSSEISTLKRGIAAQPIAPASSPTLPAWRAFLVAWLRRCLLSQVISERDILGTQLVRRNDELALLYEKIKIQQSTLNKGEQGEQTRRPAS